MDTPASARNEIGQFVKGHPGGPGRPKGRVNELQRAAEAAVTPEHISAIIRRAVRAALEGNLAAARLVLERVCGRPTEGQREPVPLAIDLPSMRTAADCDLAMQKVVEGITSGSITEDAARLLLDAITARMKSIELNDHGRRLAEIEKAAASVELPGSKSRGGY